MKLLTGRLSLGLLLGACFVVQATGLGAAHAGAWNKPQWGFFLQLGAGFSLNTTSTARLDSSANGVPILVGSNYNATNRQGPPVAGNGLPNVRTSNYQSLMTDLYFEISLLRRLAVFGDINFVSARQANEGGNISYSASGIGDTMLGARIAILERPVAFAFEGRLYIPSGDPLKIIPLGTGDFRGEMRLALGKAWDNKVLPVYVEAETGVMLRGTGTTRSTSPDPITGDYTVDTHYAPEFLLHGELGITAVRVKQQDRLLLSAGVDYRRSTRAMGQAERSMDPVNLTPNTQEYTLFNFNAVAFLWKGLGVSARYSQICQGRNTLMLSTVYGGVFASF